MRDGRPPKSQASKILSGSRNAKPEKSMALVEMQHPEIAPEILDDKGRQMWLQFIKPMAEAGLFLESDRIGATIIAYNMGRLFATEDEKEKRLITETILDFLNAYGLTSRSRDILGIKATVAQPESRVR